MDFHCQVKTVILKVLLQLFFAIFDFVSLLLHLPGLLSFLLLLGQPAVL